MLAEGGVNAQFKNPPAEHETLGHLDDPIEVNEGIEEDVWTIVNETGCGGFSIQFYFSYTSPSGTSHLISMTIPLPIGAMSTTHFTQSMFLSLLPTGVLGGGQITHMSAYMYYQNINLHSNGFYPSQSLTIHTSQLPPCHCFQWIPDPVNRKVYIRPCL